MQAIRRHIAPGEDFRVDVARYTRLDAVLGLLFALAFVGGWQLSVLYQPLHDYFLLTVKLFFAPLAAYLIVYFRGHCIASLGLRKVGLGRSLRLGLITSVIAIPLSALLCLAFGQRFGTTPSLLLTQLITLFLTTGIPEELLFRGFVGKRLYGGMRSKPLALLLGGLLFSVGHLPTLAEVPAGFTWLQATGERWFLLLFCILFHIVTMLLYAKTNNLAAPILLHCFWNLTQYSFN